MEKEDDKNESVSSAKCDYRYMYRTDLSPMMPYPWNLINKNMAGLSAFKNMSSQYLAGSSDGYWHLTGFRSRLISGEDNADGSLQVYEEGE